MDVASKDERLSQGSLVDDAAPDVDDGSDWMVEDPTHDVAHEETVADGLFQNSDLDLLTMDHLSDDADQVLHSFSQENIPPPLTMNLHDCLSKAIEFEGNERIVLCFSKRCTYQLAYDGLLYNIVGRYGENRFCIWECINPLCRAQIRTTPGFTELSFTRMEHHHSCVRDDLQIRLRVALFDIRLMAEFTEIGFEELYRGMATKLFNESPDVAEIFPPLDLIESTLHEHRDDKTYRKRFEIQAIKNKQRGNPADLNYYNRRTKPLPMTTCVECGMEMRSTDASSSQDLLINHMRVDHRKADLYVNRFTFDEPLAFEQWIRNVLQYALRPNCRLKKFGVYDECMYYLCASDARQLFRNRKAAGMGNIDEMHCSCTAFICVRDFRIARQCQSPITVDYNLSHWVHCEASDVEIDEILFPEVFIANLSEKRKKTKELLQDTKLQRISRIAELGSTAAVISTRLVNTSIDLHSAASRRSGTIPNPITAFQFTTTNHDSESHGPVLVQPLPQRSLCEEGDKLFFPIPERDERLSATLARLGPVARGSLREGALTQRANFKDDLLFNHILQLELQCNRLVERMQHCRTVAGAKKYLGRVVGILAEVSTDPAVTKSQDKAEMDRRRDADREESNVKGAKRQRIEGCSGEDDESTFKGMGEEDMRHIVKAESERGPMKAKVIKSTTARLTGGDFIEDPETSPTTSTANCQELAHLDKTVAPPVSAAEQGQRGGQESRVFFKRDEQGRLVMVRRTVVRKVVNKLPRENTLPRGEALVEPLIENPPVDFLE